MFVLMFVLVVSSINAAHEAVVTGRWIWMVTCTLRTRHSELEPTLISSSLISGSEARTEAGPGSLGPRIVARVSPGAGRPGVPAPGQCCVSPGLGSWLWLPSGHWLPPPAHQCQFRPELPNVNIGRGEHDLDLSNVLCDDTLHLVWGEWQWFLVSRDPNFFLWIHEYILYHWRKTENKLSLLPIQKNIFPRIFYIISRSWH